MAGKKGSSPNVYKYFKIDGDKLSRGKGIYMSEHKDRHTCGKCGLTEFNQ
jgi:small subunit ribosomal protein S27Ae